VAQLPTTAPASSSQSTNAAYVIYTSGSTGQPKGVLVEHRNLVALCHWHIRVFSVDQTSIATLTANTAFDASVWELFPYLLSGGRVVQCATELVLDNAKLSELIESQGVTHCFLVTPLALLFIQKNSHFPSSLRYLLVGGDVLPKLDVPSLPFSLVNNYGPTECAVVATSAQVDITADHYSIGKPIDNTTVFVLNSQLERAPVGVFGELYVGGAGVARGYLNRPQLTAERFIANPFGPGRLYRTGDMVRYRPDGQLEYIGRNDFQLKIRGYRIEAGEIETALQSCGAEVALVTGVRDSAGHQVLVGYYQGDVGAEEVRARLTARLPAHLVPTYLIALEQFTLTANGKIDRKALPALDLSAQQAMYEAPQTPTEQALAAIWQQLLSVSRVGRQDNFFLLGGTSLNAIRVMGQIQERLNKQIQLKDLFQWSQLDQMALHLDSVKVAAVAKIPVAPVLDSYPLSYAQQGVFVEYQLGRGASYNIPAAIKVKKDFSLQTFDQALNLLIRQHSSLRTKYVLEAGEPRQILVEDHAQHKTQLVELERFNPSVEQWEFSVRQDILLRLSESLDIGAGHNVRSFCYSHHSGEIIIVLNFSHIAVDGWSIEFAVRDLSRFYLQLLAGTVVDLKDEPLKYIDYAYWQRNSRVFNQHDSKMYWQETLAKFFDRQLIRTDFNVDRRDFSDSQTATFQLSAEVKLRIIDIASKHKCSLFNVWAAIYSVVTAIHNGHCDVCINTDFANRTSSGTEQILGMFVNQVLLSSELSWSMNFDEVIKLISDSFSTAIAHSDVQFTEILQNLIGAPRNIGANLMSHKFSYQESSASDQTQMVDSAHFSVFDLGFTTLKYDLSLAVSPTQDGLSVHWVYNKALFKAETINLLNQLLNLVLENMLSNSFVTVGDVKDVWNETLVQYSKIKMKKFKFMKGAKEHEV
jgi:amino acid adenylation domain-containing protein